MILSLNVVSQGRGQIFPFRIVHKGVNPYPIHEKNFPKIVMVPQKNPLERLKMALFSQQLLAHLKRF